MYKIGIEMEVIPRNGFSKSEILRAIREAGIYVNDSGYTHRVMNTWKCVSDSSLTYGGFELVSPPMKGASNIDKQITTICEAIKDMTKVDRTCGIHVHFEVLDKHHFKRRVNTNSPSGKLQALKNKPAKLFTAKLLRNYGYFQPVINSLVAPSRRDNYPVNGTCYCQHIPNDAQMNKNEISQFINNKDNYAHLIRGMSGRYQVINLSSLENYGTVEFRQMNGSTNENKILNWIRIMERLVSRSWDRKYANLDCKDFNLTIDGFMDFLGFTKSQVRTYSRNRARNNGFSAISALETRTANTPTIEIATRTGDTSNETLNNSGNLESWRFPHRADDETLTNHENMSLSAEVREACFILDNDRDYYNQIATAIRRYENNQIRRIDLHLIVKNILRMHDEIPWFPIDDSFRAGLFVKAVIIYYVESILE